MALIQFQNNQSPYLNAENLNNNFEYLDNKMQTTNTVNSFLAGYNSNNNNIYFRTENTDGSATQLGAMNGNDLFVQKRVNGTWTNLFRFSDYMSNFLKVETVEISIGSFTANQEKYNQEYSITIPTGYTPLGIMGYRLVGNSFTALRINGLYIDSNKIKYSIENTSNSATGSITFTVYVAFIKS